MHKHNFGQTLKLQSAVVTVYLFDNLVALRPKSTAMFMVGRSVDPNHSFPGQA